jgi:hypothetical protein
MNTLAAKLMALALPLALAAVLAAGAAASGPTSSVYSSSGAQVESALTPATSSAPQTSAPAAAATLPFTGLDLGIVCVAGALLIGVGFTLRRVTRKTPPS